MGCLSTLLGLFGGHWIRNKLLNARLNGWCVAKITDSETDQIGILSIRNRKPSLAETHPLTQAVMIEWPYQSDDSLPSSELFAEMTRFGEAIDALTDDNGFSVSMMTRTGFGKREWLFYTSDYERFMGTFNQLLAGHEPYPIQITHGDDPEWSIWQEMIDGLNARQDNEQMALKKSASADAHTEN